MSPFVTVSADLVSGPFASVEEARDGGRTTAVPSDTAAIWE